MRPGIRRAFDLGLSIQICRNASLGKRQEAMGGLAIDEFEDDVEVVHFADNASDGLGPDADEGGGG